MGHDLQAVISHWPRSPSFAGRGYRAMAILPSLHCQTGLSDSVTQEALLSSVLIGSPSGHLLPALYYTFQYVLQFALDHYLTGAELWVPGMFRGLDEIWLRPGRGRGLIIFLLFFSLQCMQSSEYRMMSIRASNFTSDRGYHDEENR